MSATTPPKTDRELKRGRLHHHATKPHGIILIMALVFAIAWAFWTFFLASPVSVP